MANEFQPQLSEPRATNFPSGSFTPTNPGNLSSLFGKLQSNRESQKQAAFAAHEAEVGSNLVKGLLDLEDQFLGLNLAEKQLRDEMEFVNTLPGGEKQVEATKRLQKKFESIKQMRRQGIGDENVYRIKANQLLKQAAIEAPSLYKFIQNVEEGSADELPEATTEFNKQQQKLFQEAEKRYGPGFTLKQYNEMIAIEREKARFATETDFGTISSEKLAVRSGQMFHTAAQAITREFQTILDKQGAFTPDDEARFELQVKALKDNIDSFANQKINEMIANGRELTSEDIAKIKGSYQEQFEYLASWTKDKDLNTRMKLYNEAQSLAIQSQFPALMLFFKDIDQAAGIGGVNALISIMKDENVQNILARSGKGFIDGFNFTGDEVIANVMNLIMNGVEIKDPELQKIGYTISSTLLRDFALEQPAAVVVDLVDQLAKDESGNVISGNVPTAVRGLLNNTTKRNLVAAMSEKDRVKVGNMVRNWTIMTVGRFQDEFEKSKGKVGIRFDRSSQSFVGETSNSQFGRNKASSERRATSLANTANDLLRLADDPLFSGIVPTRKEIENAFKNGISEADSLLKEQQELNRQEEEERKANFQPSGRNK